MTKNLIIIALLIALIYLYYQQKKKSHLLTGNPSDPNYQQEVSEAISELKLDKEIMETERDDLKKEKTELQAKLTNKETELTLILNK